MPVFVLVSISAAVAVDWRQGTEKLWSMLSGGYSRLPLAFFLGRTWLDIEAVLSLFFSCSFHVLFPSPR